MSTSWPSTRSTTDSSCSTSTGRAGGPAAAHPAARRFRARRACTSTTARSRRSAAGDYALGRSAARGGVEAGPEFAAAHGNLGVIRRRRGDVSGSDRRLPPRRWRSSRAIRRFWETSRRFTPASDASARPGGARARGPEYGDALHDPRPRRSRGGRRKRRTRRCATTGGPPARSDDSRAAIVDRPVDAHRGPPRRSAPRRPARARTGSRKPRGASHPRRRRSPPTN